MAIRPAALGLAALLSGGQPAAATGPLSAIDWLTETATAPPGAAPPDGGAAAGGTIAVDALGGRRLDAVGLVPAEAAGLPAALWRGSQAATLVAALSAPRPDLPPAARELFFRLLLVEAEPPRADASGDGALFLARVDRLLALGALESAIALIEAAGLDDAPRIARYFDTAILLGDDERACAALDRPAAPAPGPAARVFCLARGGDWPAAAITFRTARALGLLAPDEAALVARFLDLEDDEAGTDALAPPAHATALAWRLHEAVGEPLPTATLPPAFAHADLASTAGWRAQLAAAERLARTGAIAANRLLGVYSERAPSASGGVWERVAAVQRLEAAIRARDPAALAAALPVAWDRMAEAGLEAMLPALFGEDLAGFDLPGAAGELALRIVLLSPAAEAVARRRAPTDAGQAFLLAVARGTLRGLVTPDALRGAVRDGLLATRLPPAAARLAAAERTGEALFLALDRLDAGARGDPLGVSEGLAILVGLNLAGHARRAALELLLLGPRG